MKRFFQFLFVFLLIEAGCGNVSGNGYQLKGVIAKHANEWLYIDKIDGARVLTIDSVKTNAKGEFVFEKKVPGKDFYRLRLAPNNTLFIVLDPNEQINYTGPENFLVHQYTIEGSEEGKLTIEVRDLRNSISIYRDSLMKVINAAPESSRDSLGKVMEENYNVYVFSRIQKARDFIDKHPAKLSAISAAELLNPDDDFEYYEKMSANLKKNYPEAGYAQSFINKVEQIKRTAIGQPAPDIILPNPDGQQIALSSLKGKIVLIDFWASWCGPCRMENPNVVKVYQKYKPKGFEIYSVSLDKDMKSWVAAIAQDKLEWPSHVSDLAFWSSSVVSQYGIQGIPFTVLLDKEGKIIAKGLRGEELESRLAKLLP